MNEKENNTLPIGIFDSGIGGLTVAREVINKLPNENIIYLGDTARVPYGTKSSRTVITYSQRNAKFLISKGIKLLVIACNTASSVALQSLRWDYKIPIVGVIEPGARKAAATTKTGIGGVIGTPSTILSNSYKQALENVNPDIKVISKPCPLFVSLADEGWTHGKITEMIVEKYLIEISGEGIDVLILGCTHYPLLKDSIQNFLGNEITLVDSAEETALEIKRTLDEKDLTNKTEHIQKREYYLTDVSDTFIDVANRFLGEKIEKIDMVDINI